MLRITIDLIPFGDFEAAQRLGAIDVVNDLSGTEEAGNYLIFAVDDTGEPTEMVGEIAEFGRDVTFWKLASRALAKMGE